MKLHKVDFRFIIACILMDRHQRFGGTLYVHLQGDSLVVVIQWFIYMASSMTN
jgi:hypothetical protein